MSEGVAPHIDALLQGLTAEPSEATGGDLPRAERLECSAALAAHAEESEQPQPEQPSTADLAAFLDGALSAEEAAPVVRHLAVSQGAWLEAEAVLALLESRVETLESAPEDVLDAACKIFEQHRGVTVLRPNASGCARPAPESFLPLAAASHDVLRPLYCRSQSGIWTLELFVDEARPQSPSQRAHLLLTVHVEHQAGYEGLMARVYVGSSEDTRVLIEQVVHNGEIFAEFELRDLDFWTRDAVSVVFEPADPPG